MQRRAVPLVIICLIPACMRSQTPPVSCAYKSLLETEYAFAQSAITSGVRAAFLQYLDDDAVVFRPDPKPGRKTYIEWKESGAWLHWSPQRAKVSGAGDLGFTTGPWEYCNGPSRPVIARGQFVSVWKNHPGGQWRLVADIGTSCKENAVEDSLAIPAVCDTVASKVQAGDALKADRDGVRTQDSLFARGGSSELGGVCDSLVMVACEGLPPAVGIRAAEKRFAARPVGMYAPRFVEVSKSGDLAYTYGEKHFPQNKKCAYLHVWTKAAGNDEWRLALDVEGGIHK